MRVRLCFLSVITALAVVLVGSAPSTAADNQPPVLGALSLDPSWVGLDGGSVTASIPVTDPDGTISSVTAAAYSIYGDTVSAALGPGDGDVWSGVLNVPANVWNDADSWSVEITAVDDAGGATTELLGSIDQSGQPQFDQLPDAEAAVSPHSLTAAGGPVEITATATDDRGVSEVSAVVDGDDGSEWVVALDGVSSSGYAAGWEAPANASPYARVYTVTVTAADDIGQQRFVNAGQVTVAAPPPPAVDEPPVIVAASVSPGSLPSEGGLVDLSVQAADDVGIAEVRVHFQGPDGLARSVQLSSIGGQMFAGQVQLFSNDTPDDQTWTFSASVADTNGARTDAEMGDVVVGAEPVVDPPPDEPSTLAVSERSVRLVDTGRSARVTHTVTLTNTGSTAAVAGSIGGLSRPFRSDADGIFTLEPGQSLNVTLVFRTRTAGRYVDQLEIRRDDGLQSGLGVRVIGRHRTG